MNANKEDRSIFIKCECQGEGMGVDYYKEEGYYYFSYWRHGLSNRKLSWKERIRYCWNVLVKGTAFNDEVLLSQVSVDKLIDFLLGYKRLPKDKMKKLMEALDLAFQKRNNEKEK